MLSSFRRRYQCLTQGVLRRGFATHQQGWAGSHHQARRPPPAQPAPLPTPPEKIEWWAVDGELFKAEKFDPKRVLAPLGNEHIPNRKRRKERIKHLSQTRLKLKVHGQESYWATYMKRFQAMRDEWERHVWDPIPVPVPKPRNPSWLAEESEKYVWKDPRRDAYTFDVSRMDHSASRSRFDNKIGYKVQGMNRYPVEGRRDPGGSSVRPGITPMRQDSYKDSRSYESAYRDQRYGHQRSTDIGRQNSRQFEYDKFEDVFDDSNTTRSGENVTRSGRNVTRSGGNATENRAQSVRHRQQASTEDDEDDSDGVEFNWDESDSEEADGDGDDNNVDDEDEDVSKSRAKRDQSRRRGWYGNEDDLFKDDD